MKNIAVVFAAGNSTRFSSDKMFTPFLGQPLLFHTLQPFQTSKKIDEIVLVLQEKKMAEGAVLRKSFSKIKHIITGGKHRFDSVLNALNFLEERKLKNARLLLHNGANPFVSVREIEEGIASAEKHKNVVFGFFTPNAIKLVNHGRIDQPLDRDRIFECQTPQISDLQTLLRAVKTTTHSFTDEAELLLSIGEEVFVYECSPRNHKITFPSDLLGDYRIGMGEDSHRFATKFDAKNPLTLGGVKIPESQKTFDANSDGDVIVHALCNAILSSVGDKTLDNFADQMCKDGTKDSVKYLTQALHKAQSLHPHFVVQNVVVSLVGSEPRIAPHHEKIQKKIASLLHIETEKVGLTYTSGEKLSDFGKGLGLRCTVQILSTL